MKGQAGFWDFEHSLAALSAEGDPLEQLERTVRFERFRPALIKSKALDRLFHTLDQAISDAGYLAMGGQIIDATLVAAPKRGVVCVHEILSFSDKDAPSDADLRALAIAYLERRAPANLAWLRIHRPEGRNPHIHIMLSASDLDGRRRSLSRTQFADVKREVEEFQRAHFPHLAHSLCAAQHSQARALRRGEQEARRPPGGPRAPYLRPQPCALAPPFNPTDRGGY